MSMKIKRLIIMSILIVFVSLVTYFNDSIPFRFIKDDQISIIYIENSFDNGKPNQSTKQYNVQPDSVEFQQIKNVFEKFSYHRCFDTIFSDASISGGSQTFLLNTKGWSVIISDVPKVIVGDKVYRVGYWGNSEIKALNNELLEVLSKVEPIFSN